MEASEDVIPSHIVEVFAAKSPQGGTIAIFMLIFEYLSEMMTEAFGDRWLEGGKLSVRFKAPAHPQDTITAKGKIDSIEQKEGGSLVNCSVECCNQKGETVIAGGAVVRL